MERASKFDRAVGFFSSSIYILAWDALLGFIHRGGTIRVICSPYLAEPDVQALVDGYDARNRGMYAEEAVQVLERIFADENRRKATEVLATLVSLNILDLRVAFIGPGQAPTLSRLFHDKVGIFYDNEGESVAFKGSMNETWSGLSNSGNLESVDVYVTWEHQKERSRVVTEIEYFNALWDNKYPGAVVEPFPQVARERLASFARPSDLTILVQEIQAQVDESRKLAPVRQRPHKTPLPHQVDALKNWRAAGKRGILEHATGSGKTFTAICAIRGELEDGKVPLIVVPSDLLLHQWVHELRDNISDMDLKILRCGAGNSEWRDSDLLGAWSREPAAIDTRIVVSTIQSACRPDFLARLRQGNHLFLVADEVHRTGSGIHQNIFQIDSGPRLGLSATPRRYGDFEGTQRIFDYFGQVIKPVFTIHDAIQADALTPYFYFVRTVPLSNDEQRDWDTQTVDIQVFYARYRDLMRERPDLRARFNFLLIQRAKITKMAEGKVGRCKEILMENYQVGAKWLVYCENQVQLRRCLASLRDEGLPAVEYHSAMSGDREQTLRAFDANGGIVVSIKCLDEGVDIPSVTHALILASSKNPREFIQRRGRVLRKYRGKHYSSIYDVVTLPNNPDSEEVGAAMVAGELARSIEFAKHASNPSASNEIVRLGVRYGVDVAKLVDAGLEDDTDE